MRKCGSPSYNSAVAPRENSDLRSLALLWSEAVRCTHHVAELLALSNNYFETWGHIREVAYLPPQCQPRRMPDLEALLAYALDVYQCYRARGLDDNDTAETLEALFIFTGAVKERASLLRGG